MWQPHTKVNTQRVKRVLSLGGLFCGASGARPPSLGCFLWGFSLYLALKVPRDDHITDGHHPKNWFSGIPTVQGAVQAAEISEVGASVADAFTSVTVLTTPSVPGDLTATEGSHTGWLHGSY